MIRDFKGVWIPREIYLNPKLNAYEKILFAEIHSLSSLEHGCFASNEYFANFLVCSESAVQKYIANLKNLGLIEVLSFDGRKRILGVCTVNNDMQSRKIYEAGSQNISTTNTAIKPNKNKLNTYIHTNSAHENFENQNSETTSGVSLKAHEVGQNDHTPAADSIKTETPPFIKENQEKIRKVRDGELPKPANFEVLIGLPKSKKIGSLENAFRAKMIEGKYMNQDKTPIGDSFEKWEKFIKDSFEFGHDYKDNFHFVNSFDKWVKTEMAQAKSNTQTKDGKVVYSQNKEIKPKKANFRISDFDSPKVNAEALQNFIFETTEPKQEVKTETKTSLKENPYLTLAHAPEKIDNIQDEFARNIFDNDLQKAAIWLIDLDCTAKVSKDTVFISLRKVSNYDKFLSFLSEKITNFKYQIDFKN